MWGKEAWTRRHQKHADNFPELESRKSLNTDRNTKRRMGGLLAYSSSMQRRDHEMRDLRILGLNSEKDIVSPDHKPYSRD